MTACPSSNTTFLKSFGGTPNPPDDRGGDGRGTGRSRSFFFAVTVLYCWAKFWDTAAQDFHAYYRVTYSVLYITIILMAWIISTEEGYQ